MSPKLPKALDIVPDMKGMGTSFATKHGFTWEKVDRYTSNIIRGQKTFKENGVWITRYGNQASGVINA